MTLFPISLAHRGEVTCTEHMVGILAFIYLMIVAALLGEGAVLLSPFYGLEFNFPRATL